MRPNQSGKRKEVRFLPITLRQPHITAPCSAAKIHHNYTQTTTHHCTLQWSQNTPQLHSDDHISLHCAVEPKYTRITLRRPHITARCSGAKIHQNYTQTTTHHCTEDCAVYTVGYFGCCAVSRARRLVQ